MRGLAKGLRNIQGVAVLVKLGLDYGLTTSNCLIDSDIPEAYLNDPSAMITREQLIQVIRNLHMQIEDITGYGVLAGSHCHTSTLGILGLALTSSPNIREALILALRFFNLTFALAHFSLKEIDHHTIVTIDASFLPLDIRRFIIERATSTLVTILHDLYPKKSAVDSIDFTFPITQQIEPYLAIFGVQPTFSTKANVVRLRTDILLRTLPQANTLMLKIAIQQCQKLSDQLIGKISFTTQIRELLTHNISVWSDMESIARYFCITSRTLRRRLAEEGTTFINLRDEVRITIAIEYLTSSQLSIYEISSLLNYSSPTSFITAFKRLKGSTPSIFRKKASGNGNDNFT